MEHLSRKGKLIKVISVDSSTNPPDVVVEISSGAYRSFTCMPYDDTPPLQVNDMVVVKNPSVSSVYVERYSDGCKYFLYPQPHHR